MSSLEKDSAELIESSPTMSHSDKACGSVENKADVPSLTRTEDGEYVVPSYRLYRRRFVGLVGLLLLNFVGGMVCPWFGPIANDASRDLHFTVDQVNWFSNVVNLTYLPFSVIVPVVCKRWGTRMTCYIGSVFLLVSAWVRYAGTASSLKPGGSGSYALIMLGQIIGGIAQPAFQVLGPMYSETWFDLKGRTTATMVLSIANPFGGAIAQIIAPSVGSTKESILVLGIICTVIAPCAFLVSDQPPTPPTYAGSQSHLSFSSLVRAMLGLEPQTSHAYMTRRERVDFAIVMLNFGVLVGVVTSFSILTSQDFEPYGYSDDTAGFMGATLLLVGLVVAGVTSPIFDRVLTRHLALTCKILCPTLGVLWLVLIWAVKPNDTGALYAIMALIGAASLTLLPVALELSVEVTRNASGSSAILWFAGNLVSIICVLVEDALQAGPDADPPNNMHRAIIFQGAFVFATVGTIVFLRGKQTRRERDEQRLQGTKRDLALVDRPS